MYYLYDLNQARQAHLTHGGVLLDFDVMFVVCTFEQAVDLRTDDFADPLDRAQYWAVMGECGYDETEPPVHRLKALLTATEQVLLVDGLSASGG